MQRQYFEMGYDYFLPIPFMSTECDHSLPSFIAK